MQADGPFYDDEALQAIARQLLNNAAATWQFPTIRGGGVPHVRVLITRILLFRARYKGSPIFGNPPPLAVSVDRGPEPQETRLTLGFRVQGLGFRVQYGPLQKPLSSSIPILYFGAFMLLYSARV